MNQLFERQSKRTIRHRKITKALEIQGSVGPGGSERHTMILAKGLKQSSTFDVVVFGPYGKNPAMLQEIRSLSIPCYDVDLGYDIHFARRLKRLVEIIKQHQIDVIHTHLRIADIYGTIAGLITGTPVVATLHGRTGPLEGPVSLKGQVLKYLHAQLLNRGTRKMIAISNFVKEFNINDLRLKPDKIDVIYNCTDPNRFDITVDVEALRQQIGISPQVQVVALIGGISRQKGAHYFVDMADSVADICKNVQFLVIGKGYFENEMKSRVQEKGLATQFTFTGWRSDIPRLMHATDILVMPAYQEGFGRVVTEAMAASKPAVAFASGAIPEIVVHSKTGYVAPYGDVETMARYVVELLRDEEKRRTFGQAGRRRVQDHFSPQIFIERTADVLKSVVDSSR